MRFRVNLQQAKGSVAKCSERVSEVEMKRFVWLLSILLLVPSVSSCGCDAILRTRLDPSTLTLTVGETAPPPQASVQECFEPWRTVEIEYWRSENPDIASVDADTGEITGVAPGETTIIAGAEKPEPFGGRLSVTVIAPATTAR